MEHSWWSHFTQTHNGIGFSETRGRFCVSVWKCCAWAEVIALLVGRWYLLTRIAEEKPRYRHCLPIRPRLHHPGFYCLPQVDQSCSFTSSVTLLSFGPPTSCPSSVLMQTRVGRVEFLSSISGMDAAPCFLYWRDIIWIQAEASLKNHLSCTVRKTRRFIY